MPVHVLISDTKVEKFLDHLFENIVKPQLAVGVLDVVCDAVSATHTDDTLNIPVYNALWHNENFNTLISTNA